MQVSGRLAARMSCAGVGADLPSPVSLEGVVASV